MNVTAPPRVTINRDTKRLILQLIKAVKLDEAAIEDEEKRNWYIFGAYDYAGKLADRIKEIEEDRSAVLE